MRELHEARAHGYHDGYVAGLRDGYQACLQLARVAALRDDGEDPDYQPPRRELEAPLRRIASVK